jgi:uncharacterized protein (UPF0147 family)
MSQKESSEEIQKVILTLSEIKEDDSVPKNIRIRIDTIINCLNKEEKEACLNIDEALQSLDDISNDSNLPVYTRVEILNIMSSLEITNRSLA